MGKLIFLVAIVSGLMVYLSLGAALAENDEPVPRVQKLTGLSVAANGTSALDVSWNAAKGADHYLVQWKTGSGSYNGGEETTRTSHAISDLSPGTTYTVGVSALDDAGKLLAQGEAAGTTGEVLQLTGLAVAPGGTSRLGVTWDAVKGAEHYLVQWKTGSGSYNDGDEAARNGYTITDLSPGTAYTVRVSALDNAGNSLAEGEASGTTEEPLQLTGLSVAANGTSELAVSWAAARRADQYVVQWKSGSDSYNDGDGTAQTSYTITGLSPGTTYTIRVSALDDAGNLLARGEASGATDQEEVTGGELTGLSVASNGTTGLDVSWDAVTGAEQYVVRWKTGSGSYNNGEETAHTGHTISDLSPGTTYTVRVSALDDAGTLLAKAEASGTTDQEEVTEVELTGLSVTSSGTTGLELTWDAVGTAEKYQVQWKTGSESYNDGEETTQTSYAISGLSPGTTYKVRVSALDDAGNLLAKAEDQETTEEEASDPETPGDENPAALTGLTITASGPTQLDVSWGSVTGAEQYVVKWKTESGGNKDRATTNQTSYSITGLSPSTTYIVLVEAVDPAEAVLAEGEARGTTLERVGSGTDVPGNPGDGGNNNPGNGGGNNPGNGGGNNPGNGGTGNPGDGGATNPGDGNTGNPGDGGLRNPGNGGALNPGNGVAGNPGDIGAVNPGDSQTADLTGLSVVADGSTQLVVSWDAVAGAARYVLVWKTGSGNYGDPVSTTNSSYTIPNLSPATTYTVRVGALNDSSTLLALGEASGATAESQPETRRSPSGLTATEQNGAVVLAWTPGNDSRISGQQVKRREPQQHDWVTIAVGADVATHTDSGVESGKNYIYRVSSLNSDGDSLGPSNRAVIQVEEAPPPANPPAEEQETTAKVGDLAATVSNGAVVLSWTPRDDPRLSSQRVMRREPQQQEWVATEVSSDATTYTDESVEIGKRYIYRISSWDSDGDSLGPSNRAVVDVE